MVFMQRHTFVEPRWQIIQVANNIVVVVDQYNGYTLFLNNVNGAWGSLRINPWGKVGVNGHQS